MVLRHWPKLKSYTSEGMILNHETSLVTLPAAPAGVSSHIWYGRPQGSTSAENVAGGATSEAT